MQTITTDTPIDSTRVLPGLHLPDQVDMNQSYYLNKQITRRYAKSFYFASQFLPAEKRRATYALYGFCRFTDNIADELSGVSEELALVKLSEWEAKLKTAISRGYSDDPILMSFIDAANTYNINMQYAFDLIEGGKMDLLETRYHAYPELQKFCYHVASVVGLMMTSILGYRSEEAIPYAIKLGEGMQLTNILRDIREDFERGRVYLCQTDLRRFCYSEQDIQNHVINNNFRHLMEYYLTKAEGLYRDAEPGIDMLVPESKFAIRAASRIYGGIIGRIRDVDYDVYSQRVSLSKMDKIKILIQEKMRPVHSC